MEESKHGVIFFALGASFKPGGIPQHLLEAFLEAFSRLPQRVLVRMQGGNSMGIECQMKKVKIPGLSAVALSAYMTFLKPVLNLQNSRPIALSSHFDGVTECLYWRVRSLTTL